MAFVAPVHPLALSSRTSFHTPLSSRPTYALSPIRVAPQPRANTRTLWYMGAGVYYATTTGNTEEIASALGEIVDAEPMEVEDLTADTISDQNPIFIGAPTWNTGASTERSGTEIDKFMKESLGDIDFSGKKVSVFGLGDGVGYAENFCDAIEEIHDNFAKAGATMVGYTDPDGVEYEESKSIRDGKFLGIAIDTVNGDEDENMERLKEWATGVMGSV